MEAERVNLLRRTFDMPPRCSIKSVTVRECDGTDESQAVLAAENKNTTMYTELMRLSVERINDEPVLPGTAPLERWTSRTRKAVSMFFDHLNDVSDEEIAPLLMTTEAVETVLKNEKKQLGSNDDSEPNRSGVIDTSAVVKEPTGSG